MNDTQSASDPVTAPTRAEHAAGMAAYQEEGLRLAAEIGNRGPIRLTDQGRLHPDILAAYWKHGFYVFEGLIGGDELAELCRDANEMLERAPVGPDADVDARGRPAPPYTSKRSDNDRHRGRVRSDAQFLPATPSRAGSSDRQSIRRPNPGGRCSCIAIRNSSLRARTRLKVSTSVSS